MDSRDDTTHELPEEEPTRPQPPPPQPPPEQPRRLYRSRDDRVIAGLCGGLGRYFGIDPVILRIAAVASIFLGGAGVLLYIAGLLLVPTEPDPGAPGAPPAPAAAALGVAGEPQRNRTLMIVLVVVALLLAWPVVLGGGLVLAAVAVPLAFLAIAGLAVWWLVSGEGTAGNAGEVARRAALGLAILIALILLGSAAAFAAAAGGGVVMASVAIGAGVALIAGAFLGHARWLILPALAVALPVAFVAAADLTLDGGVGEHQYRPGSAADLRDRYELGMGSLIVDLRHADLPAGDTRVEIDLGIGEARLIVPDDVCVAGSAEVGMGAVDVFDHTSDGVDVEWESSPMAPAGKPRVVVDGTVGMGQLSVRSGGDVLGEPSDACVSGTAIAGD